MSQRENQLSLLSIEVLISHVQIELNVECHLPCMVFRLLDYPAVSIPYFDQWQVEDFHQLKKTYPNVSWRQLLSDQFYELRSANGKWKFNRGKSCLFKSYFRNFYQHLLNVPLFLLLIDQIHEQNVNQSHFIGSGNIKLNELVEVLNQSIRKNGNDVPLVEQQTFHCTLFNLMGTKIGSCDLAVRFCHYGTTILTQLPMLDEKIETKVEKKIPTIIKEPVIEPITDAIAKHIHLVNEKKDIGLQISRSDLPSSSNNNNNKSAQTRWTSTKSRPSDYHQTKSRYLRTMEDPSLDDPTIAFYRPPPLYFNSDSDFLLMMTPATTRVVEEAKENRLSYLASIPIASFDESLSVKDDPAVKEQRQTKRKSVSIVRTDLPSSKTTAVSRTKTIPKQPTLAKDFLHDFPLLRALVEEALALQPHQEELPASIQYSMSDRRRHSAVPPRQTLRKGTPVRPRSAATPRSVRSKSVIIARTIPNTRRLYPPPSKTNPMGVTKNEMRYLVDRLSKPKVNIRVERELAVINQDTPAEKSLIKTPRQPAKPISSARSTQKPLLPYGTTRAHRLMAELSRARRGILKPQPTNPPKSQTPPKKQPTPKTRISPSPPQIVNTTTISQSSLLNKVDVDTPTVDKQSIKRPSLGVISENTSLTIESVSTTSKDVTLKLNRTLTMPVSSTPKPVIRQENQENDDLNFSISDVTDYFTDGGESNARP